MASDVNRSQVIVCVVVSLDYQEKGCVYVVQNWGLSEVNVGDAEGILSERVTRCVEVGEVI